MKQIIAKMVIKTLDGTLFLDYQVAYACAREFNKMDRGEPMSRDAYVKYLDDVETRISKDLIQEFYDKGYNVYQEDGSGNLVSV